MNTTTIATKLVFGTVLALLGVSILKIGAQQFVDVIPTLVKK